MLHRVRDRRVGAHLGKGMGVAVGDFDTDGRLDIFVANDTTPNFLFRNRGDGTFEEVAVAAGVAYNENGAAISAMGAEFRDYDNDGREDLFVTALTNETFALFHNQSQGRFEDVSSSSGIAKATLPWTGWSTVMADFNNDGWKDLFTANGHVMDNAERSSGRRSMQPNLVLTNGRTSFSGRTLAGAAMNRGLAWADFDRDGRIDLVLTRLNQPAQILWNRTGGGYNWIELDLRGAKSNRDAIGAWVEIETAEGKPGPGCRLVGIRMLVQSPLAFRPGAGHSRDANYRTMAFRLHHSLGGCRRGTGREAHRASSGEAGIHPLQGAHYGAVSVRLR